MTPHSKICSIPSQSPKRTNEYLQLPASRWVAPPDTTKGFPGTKYTYTRESFRKCFNYLRRWVQDIDDTLMHSHFELFSRILVHECRAVDGILLDFSRKRNWTIY